MTSAPEARGVFSIYFLNFRSAVCTAMAVMVVLLPLASLSASAETATPMTALTKTDKADLGRIEAYLNSITTMDSRFLQVTSLGDFSEGRIYIARPGRIRIDYDAPNPIQIIANYGTLKYVDRDLEQVSYIALKDTPAGVLLREHVDLLGGEFIITRMEREAQTIRISLQRADDPLQGVLTLVFSDQPLTLRKWEVVDTQGLLTAVALQGARFAIPIRDKMFEYVRPPR